MNTNKIAHHQNRWYPNRWHTILIALICVSLLNLPIDRTSLSSLPDGAKSAVAELLPPTAQAAPSMQNDLPPLTNINAVAGGNGHTCANTMEGGVKCWGHNDEGQLGDGSTSDSTTPVDVVGLSSGITAIAAGSEHTCVLNVNGGVKCWGRGWEGQLGNSVSRFSTTPIDVIGLSSGITAIAARGRYTCALTTEGGVKCWGDNDDGQLGNGALSDSTTPVDVSGLSTGVTDIAVGYNHTCAVASGGVKCWGNNDDGQLGNGSTSSSPTPIDVSSLSTGVTDIAVGYRHTCAVASSGVKCWGNNESSQLGDGSTDNSSTLVAVMGLSSDVSAIDAGSKHTCALTADGGVKCWGDNDDGQLGNGTIGGFADPNPIPVDVNGLSTGVVTLAAGGFHNCARIADYSVKCWGRNIYGQLGNGSEKQWDRPVDVSGLTSGLTAIAAGFWHSCALTVDGGVKCWGRNIYGQLGGGSTSYLNIPVDVLGLSSGVTAITAGFQHSCALTVDGGVKCWGNNSSGQLGNGSTSNSTTPVQVLGLSSGVTAITTKSVHTCALVADGGVKCWGGNEYGQLGDGSTNDSTTPVDVSNLQSGVTAISAGLGHTCALTADGGVKCWGENTYGQLGNRSREDSITPVDVLGLSSGVTAIAAGFWHTCAVGNGGAKCWGYNSRGQVGNGRPNTFSDAPVDVVGLSEGITNIVAGDSHSCALTTDDGVKCWGNNDDGQLGNGSTSNSTIPVDVSNLSTSITTIAAGGRHSCVLTTDGSMKCWGTNDFGQVDGFPSNWNPIPIAVVDLNAQPNSPGDVNCDGNISSVDALFVLQYNVGLRADSGGCPLPDENSLHVEVGDVDGSGVTDAVDSLFILQCEVGIPNAFCPEVTAASVMNAEEAVTADEVKRLLAEQGLWEAETADISIFVPLITR